MLSLNRREFLAASAAAGTLLISPNGMSGDDAARPDAAFERITPPDWVKSVTRMSYLGPDAVADCARIGVQVVHGNAVWPYYPLKRDGGSLKPQEHELLSRFVESTKQHGMRLVLGLPPFPSVSNMLAHPEWRTCATPDARGMSIEPLEDNLGTRLGCNLGPWGDYLIELCAELMHDYGLDGYSFDGNYHAPLCHCDACIAAYESERGLPIPAQVNLDDVAYREYLVWRGEKLEDHYRRLQQKLKSQNPDAVVMTWTVNAGRYGHFLHSPRAMPTRLNLLIDLPMQEWWLDETNFGASVAPSFGAEYLAAVTNYGPVGCEPYLMTRGNPYSTDSFPQHERLTRSLLTLAHGSTTAHSVGWQGGVDGAEEVFAETIQREPWIMGARPLKWGAILVSEQTRQFYAYRDIADRFLPHVFGAYRAAMEEHLPIALINDWDVTVETLSEYRVVFLPNAAALSESQCAAIRDYVAGGGGIVATTETSLCDELGRARDDFALADVFGVSYRGRPTSVIDRSAIDVNFAAPLTEEYWQQRVGAATLTWGDHPLCNVRALKELVPGNAGRFKGPAVLVTAPSDSSEQALNLLPDGPGGVPQSEALPGMIVRPFGTGRVVYLAAALDASMWSYSYPFHRVFLSRALVWAAGGLPSIEIAAPRCVEAVFKERTGEGERRQLVIHLMNNLNTAGGHGLPANDVPLREETVAIHDIRVTFRYPDVPSRFHFEPEGLEIEPRMTGDGVEVILPPLELHSMLICEE
jgi:hypothetical protein